MSMKTLIEVDRRTWGKVKDVATVSAVPVGSVAGIILSYALGTRELEDKKGPSVSDIRAGYGKSVHEGLAELKKSNKNRQVDSIDSHTQPREYLSHGVA